MKSFAENLRPHLTLFPHALALLWDFRFASGISGRSCPHLREPRADPGSAA
jgi:hypothetical protein